MLVETVLANAGLKPCVALELEGISTILDLVREGACGPADFSRCHFGPVLRVQHMGRRAGANGDSVVGLAGSWGAVTLGRQNTLLADSVGVADPIGLRFAGMNPNIQVTSLTGHQLGVEFGATGSSGASNRVNNNVGASWRSGPVRLMPNLGRNTGETSATSRRSKVYVELDTARWKGNYLGSGNKQTSNASAWG